MYLAMGVPVIASRQESFRFLEEYECGVLVANVAEFLAAIQGICGRLEEMRANAKRCWNDYVATERRYGQLVQAVAATAGERAPEHGH